MRATRLLCVVALLGAVLGGSSMTASAKSPYPVNMRISAHKAVEFHSSWLFEAEPCFVAVGDLTEVLNAEAHALAAGIDDDGNFIAPFHVQENVEQSVLFEPDDPALPTYSGHSTVHVTNYEDSPKAGFTNTIVLRGTDGSHLLFHQDLRINVTSTGVSLFVDHTHVRCG